MFISKYILLLLVALKYTCKITYKVHGLENLKNLPTVFVANHQGVWEVLYLMTLTNPTIPIVKKELLVIPFFGWGLSLLQPITINRVKTVASLKKVIKKGKEKINKKFSILVFPEGTRVSPNAKDVVIKRSALELAKQSNTSITPIYHNSGKYWLNKSLIKKPGQIEIFIGKQIRPNETNNLKAHIENWMKEKIRILNI
ncbi:1-acyl-sn-glycerol-3-phosphate acyltransferase [Pseudomonadota bacterium]|nr:1-acyl-sn-glycerol-3-phosphate acyltransferase [Pseudomonadota bacterium]